jgi:hypothetical protein
VLSLGYAQLLVAVFRHASDDRTKLEELRIQVSNRSDVVQARVAVLHHLIEGLIERRAASIETAFSAIVDEYSAQARHYLSQQHEINSAFLDSIDPLVRGNYQQRLLEIDASLASIRRDMRLVYCEMVRALDALGITVPILRDADRHALQFT